MKIGNRCLAVAAVTALMTAAPKPGGAQAAPPGPVVTFNEYGNITIGGVPGPLGTVLLDPVSGLPTLAYSLPFPTLIGDIFLLELPPGSTQFSDLLRFLPNPLVPGSTLLYVYSDATPVDPPDPGNLADHFFMPAPGALPFVIVPETGPEDGVNGLFGYVAPPGSPGFVPGLNPTYNFISDSTPEPGSLLLMATGGLSMLLWRRRTRAKRDAA